jgi:hypothetical protein
VSALNFTTDGAGEERGGTVLRLLAPGSLVHPGICHMPWYRVL